jgi:isopenicillin-N epimerase
METIIDAAHSLGQVDFGIRDLGANFVGLSLHKWMGSPMGTGLIYIRKGNAHRIDPHFRKIEENSLTPHDRLHTGTVNFASFLTIPEAIRFYQTIPASLRHERLRFLREIWTERFRNDPRIEVLAPPDPRLNTGMAAFRVKGKTDYESNHRLTQQLWEKARILTVPRTGLASGVCIRVTPAPYTLPDEIQTFADTLDQLL